LPAKLESGLALGFDGNARMKPLVNENNSLLAMIKSLFQAAPQGTVERRHFHWMFPAVSCFLIFSRSGSGIIIGIWNGSDDPAAA
jgi:hypothetical protein